MSTETLQWSPGLVTGPTFRSSARRYQVGFVGGVRRG